MTLFRQIAIVIAAVFILLLAALLFGNFRQSSHFIQGQMQTAANDTATSLGITIANSIEVGDKAALETLFNSVFDSGYYSRIALISMEGKTIAAKEQALEVRDVPGWFQDLVPLQAATGSTQVVKGWSHYGKLQLTLNPGYAYAELYAALTGMLTWFTLLGGASLVVLWWLLRWFMQPLQRVQQQAEAIQENRFIRQEPLPRTTELRHVVDAMNRMVDKVQAIFDDQSETLRRYHELLYVDSETGLSNRHHLLIRLEELLQDESRGGGTVVLISLQGIQQGDYRRTDEVLHGLAHLLENKQPPGVHAFSSRLSEYEFVTYLGAREEQAISYTEALFRQFRTDTSDTPLSLNAAIVSLDVQQNITEILGQADYALTQACARGGYEYYCHGTGGHAIPLGKMQWRNWLDESLSAQRFFLVGQQVQDPQQSLYHQELFIRLKGAAGEVIPAGRFMPIAASLGMESTIDREVFRIVLERAADIGPVAINLSPMALDSAEALTEFERFIGRFHKSGGESLYVEMSHYALNHHRDVARYVAELVRGHGYHFGIDHFDLGANLVEIREIRPHYIKIDARQLSDLSDEGVPGAFQPLRTLAGSLDIQLIAVGVDSPQLLERLRRLGTIGVQGNHVEEPKEL